MQVKPHKQVMVKMDGRIGRKYLELPMDTLTLHMEQPNQMNRHVVNMDKFGDRSVLAEIIKVESDLSQVVGHKPDSDGVAYFEQVHEGFDAGDDQVRGDVKS